MYTVITHTIREEHYGNIAEALYAIATQSTCGNIANITSLTSTIYSDEEVYNQYYEGVIPPPNSNSSGTYGGYSDYTGNIKVKMPE